MFDELTNRAERKVNINKSLSSLCILLSFGIYKMFISGWYWCACCFPLQQFLKEILNELCVYNKRGANQGTYELKPEYKKTVEDSGAE